MQECTPERLDMKKAVFNELDKLASDDMVLSSSSSAMPASLYSEHLKHRSQCIVSHPVGKPLMPQYCIQDIICYVKFSLFSVSGSNCIAIISLFGCFLVDSYVR